MNRLQLSDYANRYLVERLSTVPGVAQVCVAGAQLYSMRIWLEPDAMAARGITVDDVDSALNAQNVDLPAGALEVQRQGLHHPRQPPIRHARALRDRCRLPRPAPARRRFVRRACLRADAPGRPRATSAYVTRLGDIARVEEGADERRRDVPLQRPRQIGIALTRQSQANDLQISAAVQQGDRADQSDPAGRHAARASPSTTRCSPPRRSSEVWITMGISLALVALVNFAVPGHWRAAMIPSIVAPICILSTFIVLAPLGFSINL